jgi:hypothetical protein
MRADVHERTKRTPPQPRWTIPDLLDLEFALARRGARKDPAFFRELVEPWLDPEEIARPGRRTMSLALWEWLGRERAATGTGTGSWPGRAYSVALTVAGAGASVLAFSVGVGTVLGLLNAYDGRTFHVLLLLAVTIGVQWALLLTWLLGFVTVGWWREHAFVSGAQRLISAGIERMVRGSLGEEGARWWRDAVRTRRLFGLPALQVSQVAGVAFSVGSLAALSGCVLLLSVRFGWETTTAEGFPRLVAGTVRALASPWSWFRPDWVPDEAVIEGTRIEWRDGKPVMPPVELSVRWYPFLLTCLVVWGILPRIGLAVVAVWMRDVALARYSFKERAHREWWRELTGLEVQTVIAGPADEAYALLLGGMEEPAELRRVCLQQLRRNVERRAVLGIGSLEEDDRLLDEAAHWLARHKEGRLILVVESWALVPKEFQMFHAQLRAKVGDKLPLDVLLLGLPDASGQLKSPTEGEISIWEKFVAELGDPLLDLQPFQAALAH